MDLRQLMNRLSNIESTTNEADLDATQQAQNVLQPGSQKSSADQEKEKEYARAQAQMARLEKAAQYSGDDEIVRDRMGLPPKLPHISQWDGKMPEPVGEPDWIAKLSGAGDAQKAAVAANKGDNASAAFIKTKLTTLKDLVAQLQKLNGGSNLSNATAKTTTAPNMGQVNKEDSIFESLMREFQDQLLDTDIAEAASPEAQKIIDQLKGLMSELGDIDDQEVITALGDAQKEIEAAEKASSEKSADKPDPAKVARFKELLAKAKAGAPAAKPAAAPAKEESTLESMADLISRIQTLESKQLNEALTPEEKTELDALAKELETFTGQDPALDALLLQHTQLASATPAAKPGASADPAIQAVQEKLKGLGVDPGPIDGKMGPKTIAGIKAFEKLAGIKETGKVTPELTKLLDDGKNVIARSKLTTSLTAIEQLITKYKVAEDVEEGVTFEYIDSLDEDEMRSFLLANISKLSESEKLTAMKLVLSEANIVPAGGGRLPAPVAGPFGDPNVIDVPFKDVTPKPGFLDRAKSFVKNVGAGAVSKWNKLGTTAKNVVKTAVAGLGLGGLYAAFAGGDVEMDPADLKVLQDHLKVLDQYGQDPAIKAGLPADVQKRLDVVVAKLGKLKAAKAKGGAPAAAPGTAPAKPAAPAPKNDVDMSGGAGAF